MTPLPLGFINVVWLPLAGRSLGVAMAAGSLAVAWASWSGCRSLPWAWPRLAGHRLDMEPRHVQLRHVQLPQKKKVHRHNLHLFT